MRTICAEYSGCLIYQSPRGIQWRITRSTSLSHASTEKHKYIAKVKLSNTKTRYFYSREEYLKYLRGGKNAVNNIGNKVKTGLTNWKVTRNTIASKSKKAVSDLKSKPSGTGMKTKMKNGIEQVGRFSKIKLAVALVVLGAKLIKKAAKWVANKINRRNDDGAITDREKPGHKYIAKVKTPSGKMRYFYSQDEYDAYIKRQNYQKNEPDFMKHVKDIDGDDIYTSKEDMGKVNEIYSPYDESSSTNCANCSAAYELRRRGYDVEAELVNGSYNGKGSRVYDYFEKPEKLYVFGDGETKTADESFERKIWKEGAVSSNDAKKSKAGYDYYTNEHKYTSSSIEKAIKNNNPPGSRGFIDVTWKDGGAHSIVYEVDKKGKVTIKDSQTYDTYSVSELANKVSQVSITRTDNLKLKKDILNSVKTNTDKGRTYYVDESTLHLYDE